MTATDGRTSTAADTKDQHIRTDCRLDAAQPLRRQGVARRVIGDMWECDGGTGGYGIIIAGGALLAMAMVGSGWFFPFLRFFTISYDVQ